LEDITVDERILHRILNKEIIYEGVNYTQVVQNSVQLRALVRTVINLGSSIRFADFLAQFCDY
jgi:hypothetical protein